MDPKQGVWAATGINEANVGITATETITSNARVLAADPLVEYKKAKTRRGKDVPGGIGEEDLFPFLRLCAGLTGLHVRGLMAMMPLGAEREIIEGYFRRMRTLLDRCQQENVQGTDMTELSMGMSQDYKSAIYEGSTHVRIGTAIFGNRSEYKPL